MITYILLCIAWLCLIEIVDKPNTTYFKLSREYPVSLRAVIVFWFMTTCFSFLLAPLAFIGKMYTLAAKGTFKQDPDTVVASARRALRIL